MLAIDTTSTPAAGLDQAQIESFDSDGYVVIPRFFDASECEALKADIDATKQRDSPRRFLCEYPALGPLISEPRVMDAVTAVLGQGFAFHHLHAARHDAGTTGVHWHQDYEQAPQTNRSHKMVHFFYYLNGLNGEIGDLLVLPKSQHMVVDNDGLRILGTENLPGMVVVDDLPPGSAVLVHSALWHARRAKPGGEYRPRYFADASYCQAGIRWPAPGNPQRREYLARARELGLDRGGKYAHLFDEAHFFEDPVARAFLKHKQGSLVLEMQGWTE